jgi:hypothetical protein
MHALRAHDLHHAAFADAWHGLTLRRAGLALAVLALYALVMAAALRWSQPWIAREGGEVAATPAARCGPGRHDARCDHAGAARDRAR